MNRSAARRETVGEDDRHDRGYEGTEGAAARTASVTRFDTFDRCLSLSDVETNAALRVLSADRSTRLVEALRNQRMREARSTAEPSNSVSELAILGHEIIAFVRERIETTRGTDATQVEAAIVMLACDFVLRTGLEGDEGDRDVLFALMNRATAVAHD